MSTNILIKKSSVAGKAPLASDLVYGELAINYADGKLYFKDSANQVKAFVQAPTLQNITDSGDTTTDTITVGGLQIGTYSFPTTAGSTGQVLALNSSGDLEWTTVSGAGGGIALTDLSVTVGSASGNGNLTYNNSTGVFAFTPADLSTKQNTLVSGTNIKTINGISILGSGNISISGGGGGGSSVSQSVFSETYVATAGQTTFNVQYTSVVEVFLNGIKLKPSEYTANDGSTVVLNTGCAVDDVVDLVGYVNSTQVIFPETYVATAGQTTFSVQYSSYVEVFLNGIRLKPSDYTATDGSTVVLNTGCAVDDVVYLVGYSDITTLTGIVTQTYVDNAISNLIDAAPAALNTLNELAAALGDDANYATTITNALATKANTSSLATVATSGSYNDLTNKPTIPTATSSLTNDSGFITTSALSGYALSSSLATVATSGSYNDLTNKPTIPTNNNQLTNGAGYATETYVNTAISNNFTWSIVNSNTQLVVSRGYFVNTTSGSVNVTLPASASIGDTIRINDLAGTATTNNIIILRNGHKIQGLDSDLVIDYNNATVDLIYSNSTYGWKAIGL